MKLVLGMASGYRRDALQNFVSSFRQNCSGDIALIVDQGIDAGTKSWLSDNGVILTYANPIPGIPYPVMTRHYHYKTFIEQNPAYSSIFVTDVRDVVAQDDIFLIDSKGLHVFEEEECVPIIGCPLNRAWIYEWYGRSALNRYGHKNILCAGTTFGDRESMLCYADMMINEFENRPENIFEISEHKGFDQGIHNYLCHSGKLESALKCIGSHLTVHKNGDGILTFSRVKLMHIAITGFLLNHDNTAPMVIHQYDRNGILINLFDSLYGANTIE